MRILVVDDEIELAEAIGKALRREGYAADVVHTAAAAIDVTSYTPYDLITLDLTLPDGDGRDICRSIRSGHDHQPRILMLTARDDIGERVAGLDDGADDYLVKPFALPELFARVRTLLRRDTDASAGALLTSNGLTVDTAAHRVLWKDVEIEMTAKEFALLRYFMTHSNDVLSQEHLLEHVWDAAADPFTNTVRVTVGTLRRKLTAATGVQWIDTVIGAGYRFAPPKTPN
ncbi:MAG: response regulator transcription factor [Acidimicrobiales bacterium]|nr:response regulator transcription factor [Acidimicrobiales bacterium]